MPSPPRVRLALSLPSAAASIRGRALTDRQCFAVFITGEGNDVSALQMGTRQPSCFGVTGKYVGAFSSADMVAGNAHVSLSLGRHKVTLLALDKTSDCNGRDLSYFLPDSDTDVAAAYAVGSSGEVDVTASTSVVSVSTAQYEPPTNLTPVCARATQDCSNATFCDTFTDADGTSIGAHTPEVGPIWQISGFADNPVITGNKGNISASSGNTVFFLANPSSQNGTIRTQIKLGSFGLGNGGDLQILGRYQDPSNYVFGRIVNNFAQCTLTVGQKITGSITSEGGDSFSCDTDTTYDIRLTMNGDNLQFVFDGHSVSFANTSPLLTGTRVGLTTESSGIPFVLYLVDSFTFHTLTP